jgi:1,4-dihydroxy-2-naphthoate octaprenyltransferase
VTELVRPVGLGFAARGDVSGAVRWADAARREGLDSVWIHDSYFERDSVTYASAIASHVPQIRVGMGALNPFTRHPVLLAMTVSAVDEMAPGRVILGLGSALPLRLAQMGIPYDPTTAVDVISGAIDTIRALCAGRRVPAGAPNVPPVEPMFPPVHDVPIYVAGYRTPMLELAGRKGDGYLSRPLESLASFEGMVPKIRRASIEAGRPATAVRIAGYLFSLVDDTRREALNRAKREPFVIYMMAIQTDVALRRAGLDLGLRDRIFGLWRNEDYHEAAQLMPDEMLDAFLLCGTRDDVAARAWEYHQAGMELPVLQPAVQEDEHVAAVIDAAVSYASESRAAEDRRVVEAGAGTGTDPAAWGSGGVGHAEGSVPALFGDRGLSLRARARRRVGAWYEIVRPFSFTASSVPVAAAGALAAFDSRFHWALFLAALFAALFLHIGTNVINEIYDVRKGIDTITSPRASHALLKGRLSEREAFVVGAAAFVVAAGLGVWLIAERGWPVAPLGVAGLIGGLGYTAPPLQYKFRALGLPLVFLLMGPLMVIGGYFVVTGGFDWRAIVVSIPVGLLVTAILHGNEWRDISDDARAGIATFSIRAGHRVAHVGYVSLVVGAYIALAMGVAAKALPPLAMLTMLSLPLLVRAIRSSELGASGQQRAIAMIDLQTAQLHAVFGSLLVLGIALAAVR